MVKKELVSNIITMEEFILMNQEKNPELVNFMGFADEMDIDEIEAKNAKALYEEHLTFDEMVLGIKEGRYF